MSKELLGEVLINIMPRKKNHQSMKNKGGAHIFVVTYHDFGGDTW